MYPLEVGPKINVTPGSPLPDPGTARAAGRFRSTASIVLPKQADRISVMKFYEGAWVNGLLTIKHYQRFYGLRSVVRCRSRFGKVLQPPFRRHPATSSIPAGVAVSNSSRWLKLAARSLFIVAGLNAATPASAGSFAVREQSTAAQGDDFAGVAAGGTLGAMYWNPATMTEAGGLRFEGNAAAIFPYLNVRPSSFTSPVLLGLGGTASSGNVLHDAVLPSGYAAWSYNERLWLGLAANSPYGLGTTNPTNGPGQIYARTSSVRSYDLNPNVAFKVSDWLSLGAGVEAVYFKARLSRALSPLPDAPSAVVDGNDWGVGFTAGATLTPRAGTSLGIGYRSTVSETLTGSLGLGSAIKVPATAPLRLPDELTIGLRQVVTPDLTLAAGYEWTGWSSLQNVSVQNAATPASLPFYYKNGSFASLGGEYRYNGMLTLRAGAGYEWSPIGTAVRDLSLPDADRVTASVGAGINLSERLTLDLAYTHYFPVGTTRIALSGSNPSAIPALAFLAVAEGHADVASVGLKYRF